MNAGLDLRSPEFIASRRRPGKGLSIVLVILLGLIITLCSYGAMSLYAQWLQEQKESALYKLHILKDRAEQFQELENETALLQQKATLVEELAALKQPLPEWLQLSRETATAGEITLHEVSLDTKGSFFVEGEGLKMQQIAAFNRQLSSLDFLSETMINSIAMKSDQGYHFTISGLLCSPEGELFDD
jgi:cell division protein FtsB